MEHMPHKFATNTSETLTLHFLGLSLVAIVSGALIYLNAEQQTGVEHARVETVYEAQY